MSQLTTLTASESLHAWPSVVNDGKAILFTSVPSMGVQGAQVEAVEADTGKRHVLIESARFARHTPSGHLVFYREGGLLAAPFDVARLTVTGPAVEVTAAVEQDSSGAPLAETSSAGSLVYRRAGVASGRLVWVSRQGTEQPVTDVPRAYLNPRLTADNRRIVVGVGSDLWIQDALRSTFTRLTPQQSETASQPVVDTRRKAGRLPNAHRGAFNRNRWERPFTDDCRDNPPATSQAQSHPTVQHWRRHDARLKASSTSTWSRSPAIPHRVRSSRVHTSRVARSFLQMAAGWPTCRTSPVSFRCTSVAIQVPRAAGQCQLAAEPLHFGVTPAMSCFIATGTR